MVSDYVMTEHNCRGQSRRRGSVGLARYTMDSHHTSRVVIDGKVVARGLRRNRERRSRIPISYRAIVPQRTRVREPARAGLPVLHAHRLRLDPHGAGLHDPRPSRRHRRRAGDRRRHLRAKARLPKAPQAAPIRWTETPVGLLFLACLAVSFRIGRAGTSSPTRMARSSAVHHPRRREVEGSLSRSLMNTFLPLVIALLTMGQVGPNRPLVGSEWPAYRGDAGLSGVSTRSNDSAPFQARLVLSA